MKETILRFIRHKPKLRRLLSKIYLFWIWIKNSLKKKEFKEIYYINSNDIKYTSWWSYNIFDFWWKIIDWDWDLKKWDFEIQSWYKWMVDRFIHKKDWKDTIIYKEWEDKIKKWEIIWNCSTFCDLKKRLEYVDSLFNEIKKNGFKINDDKIAWKYDQVTINIWRNWELLFNDWFHRLSIAKILKLEKIPVRILVRHKKWYDFIKYLQKSLPNWVSYQSLWHVDLDTNFIIDHPCENRFSIIEKVLPKGWWKALDIWWNIGYFTRELEKKWFDTYIIEHEEFYLKILQNFKEVGWYKYKIIDEDMFLWEWFKNNKFKITIALSIFHHFLKTEDFYLKLKKLLNNLDTEILILETHNFEENQMEWSFKNYNSKEFVEFIMKETWLKSYKKLWDSEWNREIFVLLKK